MSQSQLNQKLIYTSVKVQIQKDENLFTHQTGTYGHKVYNIYAYTNKKCSKSFKVLIFLFFLFFSFSSCSLDSVFVVFLA